MNSPYAPKHRDEIPVKEHIVATRPASSSSGDALTDPGSGSGSGERSPAADPQAAGESATPDSRSLWQRLRVPVLKHTLALLLLLAIWLCTFWMFGRDCTFPASWHPDEPGKVTQVLSERTSRNFNHPLLLLEATIHWIQWFGVTPDEPSVVAAGRQVSAAFGATTVVFFAAAGYLAAGFAGLVLAALATGLCGPLMSASHYMKEDAGLAMGVAVAVFASRWVWNTRRWWTRILPWLALGAGCALAASGKYVGAVSIVLALLCVLFAPAWRWRSILPRLLLVVLGLGTWFIVNHMAVNTEIDWKQVFEPPWKESWRGLFVPRFLDGMERELDHSLTEHHGITADKPNIYVLRTTIEECGRHVLVLVAALPLLLIVTRRRGWGWEVLLVLFTASFIWVLSYTVILFARYALPPALLIHFLAALAAARLLTLLQGRLWLRGLVLVLLANAFLIMQTPRWIAYAQQFAHDSRDHTKVWLAENLPSGALVYADQYAALETPGRALGPLSASRPDLRVYSGFRVSSFGSVASLAARNCYVVICGTQYDRFFEPLNKAAPGRENEFERTRSFYLKLIQEGKPVFQHIEKYPQRSFTSPDIRVYYLSNRP